MVAVGDEGGLPCLELSTAAGGAGRESAAAGAAAGGHRDGPSSLHTLLMSAGDILAVLGIHPLCASRIPLALSVMPHSRSKATARAPRGMPLQVSVLRSRKRTVRVFPLKTG